MGPARVAERLDALRQYSMAPLHGRAGVQGLGLYTRVCGKNKKTTLIDIAVHGDTHFEPQSTSRDEYRLMSYARLRNWACLL